ETLTPGSVVSVCSVAWLRYTSSCSLFLLVFCLSKPFLPVAGLFALIFMMFSLLRLSLVQILLSISKSLELYVSHGLANNMIPANPVATAHAVSSQHFISVFCLEGFCFLGYCS